MKDTPESAKKKLRFDQGSHAKYPAVSDSRGRARVTLRSRSYYFGAHGSPESYVMYGAWLAELLRSGKAYLPSDRRNDAIDFIGEGIVKKSLPKPWVAAGMLASSVVLSGALLGCVWIFSSTREPTVDGMAMTARETELVRDQRLFENKRLAKLASMSSRVAEIANKVSTEGLPDELPPRISAKPPIPDRD